ncbi:MAG: response regulator, partial [Candidatus Rokubacteria bacterium]|nr:response regulator [Candidatus Rokubacteria bacterium]
MARVMVVDDAAFMRAMLAGILQDAGHEVVVQCENGARALALYPLVRPDLVTMDVIMPGESGVETARRLLAADPAARIIMVTGISEREVVEEALALGVRCYVLKPFDPDRVRDCVEQALAGAAGPAPLLSRAESAKAGA